MSYLEWRRFNFFDLRTKEDDGKIHEALEDTTITAVCSGNANVVIGDAAGWVHLVSRSWTVTPFKAYELKLTLAEHLKHDPFLVTIGEDEPGINPVLKVWDTCRFDRHGSPVCVRVARAIPAHMQPTQATVLTLHEDKNLMAIGFADGSVVLIGGDIARQRKSKMKTLADTGNTPITGLAFKDSTHLFVSSRSSVLLINGSGGWWGGGERLLAMEVPDPQKPRESGCRTRCSVLADNTFMVARSDAVYCHTSEGRGPCYALEGEKKRLDWFHSYLVITTTNDQDQNPSTANGETSAPKTNQITILDIQNKFIVFTCSLGEVEAVFSEWGAFYILTKDKNVHHLIEKDLQSKLALLFKKNLYHVAIKMAMSQHYDSDGLMDIHKQYGDHLYAKSDHRGAIEQYIKTIGRLETSYVIKKYLDSRHLEPLTLYLEELHKKGLATEDHTTLLLTCFVKLDQHDKKGKLREFISVKDRTISFDVEIAIKVCRRVSVDDALHLAKTHNQHDWYLKIVLEDKQDYKMALDYISELELEDAEMYTKKYGHKLLLHIPKESTEFLKRLCTDYHPKLKPLVTDAMMYGSNRTTKKARAEEYIHLFLTNSQMLVNFLEHIVNTDAYCSTLVYNTLIEHYIHVWSNIKDENSTQKLEYRNNVLSILQNPKANYDKDQTLIICQMLSFRPGILYLYEEKKLYTEIVRHHMACGDGEAALEICSRVADKAGGGNGTLWLEMLWWPPSQEHLGQVLNAIASKKLLSPMLVIDCLASTTSCTLGDTRKYLTDILKTEIEQSTRENELASKYQTETERIRTLIGNMTSQPVTFQTSRCAACHHQLELPTIHFMCQHSYHQHCFQSFADNESDCPSCAPQNAALRASLYSSSTASGGSSSTSAAAMAEVLHARLDREDDKFSVVSEYFGRGLFNKLTLITDSMKPQIIKPDTNKASDNTPATSKVRNETTYQNISSTNNNTSTYGPGAEAKLRLEEGKSKQVYIPETKQSVPKPSAIIPTPEGRMRLLEQRRTDTQYASSLETKMAAPQHRPPDISKSNKMHTSSDTLERNSPRSTPRRQPKGAGGKGEGAERSLPNSLPNSVSSSPRASAGAGPLKKAGSQASANKLDEYDEEKNPFAAEEESKNPFDDPDEYDETLNPFS